METLLRKGDKGENVKTLQRALNCYPDSIFGVLTEEAVKEFQKSHGLVVDGIVGEKTWKALSDEKIVETVEVAKGLRKSKRVINEIIVHCTASKEGVPMTVDAIRKFHVNNRGWSDIGYHYVIYLDGTIHDGRDINVSGAHCTGHNTHSIGVVYVGGLDKNGKAKDTRTLEQKTALLKLLTALKRIYPKATIHGHREFANKACPCFDAKSEYKNL